MGNFVDQTVEDKKVKSWKPGMPPPFPAEGSTQQRQKQGWREGSRGHVAHPTQDVSELCPKWKIPPNPITGKDAPPEAWIDVTKSILEGSQPGV